MSKGWKEQIKLSVGYDPWYWDIEDAYSEIDRVYAQDAKADEYEDKAKAFDEVLKSYDESLSEGHMADDVCNIVEKYKKQKEDSE